MNTTNCVIVDATIFSWYYFFAGMNWFLVGYYCMKCGDSLRKVRERELEQEREREEVITAQAISLEHD